MAKIVLDPEAFKVLASDTRVQILKSLDERPKTVSELSRELELNKATVFEHLQQLLNGELVKKKDKEGRKWVYYTLTFKGRSLLHPETTTFMVLFSMAALGGMGAFWQLGNWLAWWAGASLDGSDRGESDGAGAPEADEAGDTQETGQSGADDGGADSDQQAMEAPADGEGSPGGQEMEPSGDFFDFLADPSFWIFFALLAATVALVVAAVVVRSRGRRRARLSGHLASSGS